MFFMRIKLFLLQMTEKNVHFNEFFSDENSIVNAKIIGFNVNPKFNNCLDGLIALDLCNVPQITIESLSKEVKDGSILQ